MHSAETDQYEAEQKPLTKAEDISFNNFIQRVLSYNPHADVELIRKAFTAAKEAHKGQLRESGEDYFTHPYSVALILTSLKADSATLCAALLHDIVEESNISIEKVHKEFGKEIAELVEGVTKIMGIKYETKEEYKAENLRKILLATAKDVRVILIKLADRLHNMRTIKYFRPEKQQRIAQETLDIYAPLAHKLGIRFIKGELEDLSLKVLDPESYKLLRDRIAEKRAEREKKTAEFIKIIKETLRKHNIEAEIEGRAKYFYSIYQKMKKEIKEFNEIYDLIAIRIIVKTVPECYAALGIVHELYKPIPRRFKDYISVPKANGYQSLHTSVVGPHGKIIEIQIRTHDMHLIAEEGIAAHWRYKGTERDKRFDRKITWLKQLLEWKIESSSAKEFVDTLKIDLFENEIVVFTPHGDPVSLPEHATPIDFAYMVHSNIGDHCSKAEVNGKIVPLDHTLKSGDIVNIITIKNASPSRGWLSFVKTSKARSKIKAALHIKTDESKPDDSEGREKPENLIDLLQFSGKHKQLKLSKCCQPVYGAPILAFTTTEGKVTVHAKDCPNVHTLDQSKTVPIAWKEREDTGSMKLRVTVKDRLGILAEILQVISKSETNVQSVYTRTKKDRITITFKMQLHPAADLNVLIASIRSIKDVVDVRR